MQTAISFYKEASVTKMLVSGDNLNEDYDEVSVMKKLAVSGGIEADEVYICLLYTSGGGIKFIPLTGVTLPLVSYGGSSVLSTFIIFGIMQELYIKRQNEVERLERIKERVHY